jgi:hypothetical protein
LIADCRFISNIGDAALRGFEQSESDDAELAHSMQVRAHIPHFVGKRSLDDEVVENILLKQQEENRKYTLFVIPFYLAVPCSDNVLMHGTRNIIQEMLRSTS